MARDSTLAYPTDGLAVGIGPIEGLSVPITEIDYDTGVLRFSSPDGINSFEYDSGTLTVTNERA